MTKKTNPANWRPETKLVRGGLKRTEWKETSEALWLTSGYTYESAEEAIERFAGNVPGFVYGRYGNPTVTMFEERMALLEGAERCRALGTGMAAITTALMGSVKAGDHVIAGNALFSSCRWVVETYLPRFGVTSTFVDAHDLNSWKAAVKPNTTAFLCESPSNPMLDCCDIAGIADIAHNAGATLIVDNVFATPIMQKPLALGADLVVYSATKHIDGQGRVLGGAILGKNQVLVDRFDDIIKHTGPGMSAFNAWVLLKGLETLSLRVEKMSANAAFLADRLASHPGIGFVRYPGRADHPHADIARKQMTGGGAMLAFEVKGGREKAFRFQNTLEIIDISNNLGDAKSLITHPATTTHRKVAEEERKRLGITEGALRLSVGLEAAEDLWADMAQALEA